VLQLEPSKDAESTRAQVRDLIMQALPQETWSGQLPDGQGVALTVFSDRVVVRQTAAVQEKVERLLADSGVAKRTTGSGDRNNGGGFFSPATGGRGAAPEKPVGFGLGAPAVGGASAPATFAPGGFGGGRIAPEPAAN
jgi:hypothetical protein